MGIVGKYQCKGKCGIIAKPDPIVLRLLEIKYKHFESTELESLLKIYLTQTIFDNLKLKKSNYGATLYDCIRTGLTICDDKIGIFAADPDCYKTFEDIFNPIIENYHDLPKPVQQPAICYGDFDSFTNIDPDRKFVVSIRIRCIRNIDQYPFNPLLTEDQITDLEKKISKALTNINRNEFKGIYHPLEAIEQTEKEKLIEQKILFQEHFELLEKAQVYRFWPKGRGVFYNEEKSFLVWVNETDHMRIISLQHDGNFRQVYERLITGLKELEKKLIFTRDERLGFLTFSPTSVGTTLKANVSIKLPRLTKKISRLYALVFKHKLQLEVFKKDLNPKCKDVLYNIFNKQSIGITENDIMKNIHDALLEIIELEKTIKIKKRRKPTWRELARRRLYKKRVRRMPWLPAFLYKT